MPGTAGTGNIRGKNFKKSCWWRGGSPLIHPWDGKRHGVGLTAEGTSGQRHRRDLRGAAGPRGWGKRGLQPGPGRQAARPRGRRGAGMLPGGQRTGSRQVERDPAGPWPTPAGTAARDLLGNDQARAGNREGVHDKRPDRRLTGAAPGWSRAERNRWEGRGAERGLRPAPACHGQPFSGKDKARKHQFRRPWKVLSGGNEHQCEPPRMTPRPCQLGLT
jgi:hypothetical protein